MGGVSANPIAGGKGLHDGHQPVEICFGFFPRRGKVSEGRMRALLKAFLNPALA